MSPRYWGADLNYSLRRRVDARRKELSLVRVAQTCSVSDAMSQRSKRRKTRYGYPERALIPELLKESRILLLYVGHPCPNPCRRKPMTLAPKRQRVVESAEKRPQKGEGAKRAQESKNAGIPGKIPRKPAKDARGAGRIRTGDGGFAILCLSHLATAPTTPAT